MYSTNVLKRLRKIKKSGLRCQPVCLLKILVKFSILQNIKEGYSALKKDAF